MSKTKLKKDLKKGDVIRVEYGDFDNFMTVTVDSIAVVGNWIRITCYDFNNKSFDMWGMNPSEEVNLLN